LLRRSLAVIGALALAIATPTAALAAAPSHSDPTSKFQKSGSAPGTPVGTKFRPMAVGADGKVTVIVEMKGDPTSVAQAKKGTKLTAAERSSIKSTLQKQQDAIAGSIKADGGKIEFTMQSAYNGIQLTIPANKINALATLPNVVAVHKVQSYKVDNAVSIPFLGIPQVWQNTGYTGQGVKVAIIDTGVDYTHANFDGPGTVAAFTQAQATSTDPANPAWFGPNAPRVKGGYDFVGDTYQDDPASANYQPVPNPDPNPLDCNGHGSHVAGTAAGSGVENGATYPGPYNASTPSHTFDIGPGVAPQADIYALRVFGCAGSSDVIIPAIDWAVDHGMNVINMSLGSPYSGGSDDTLATAASNAVGAGIVVVQAAGNDGPSPYLAGNGDGVVTAAAVDSTATFPGATITVNGVAVPAVNANGADLTQLQNPLTVVRLTDNPATNLEDESLGCSVAAYTYAGVHAGGNQLAVAKRGNCARVAKAIFAQQAGAAAAVQINNAAGYPPIEGQITSNPDTGEKYTVTIPYLGIRPQDAAKLVDGAPATVAPATIDNPGYRAYASFSSSGPRTGDSALAVSVAAPGVSIVSTGVGTGNGPATISGTSMATPHVAGVAALAVQAHPKWSAAEVASVLTSTADPDKVVGENLVRGGVGLVDAAHAVATKVTATGDSFKSTTGWLREPSLSFGFSDSSTAFKGTKTITLTNYGTTAVTYKVTAAPTAQSRPASVTFNQSTVTVPAGGTAKVIVTLNGATSAVPSSALGGFSFYQFSGDVVFTSATDTLRVPYLLVPRADSRVASAGDVTVTKNAKVVDGTSSVTLSNPAGAMDADADFYTWGLSDGQDVSSKVQDTGYDLRAAGIQSFDVGGGDQLLVFAVNTYTRWSNAAANEFDVVLDTNRDGTPDWVVFSADGGQVTAGSPSGISQVFAYDLANKKLVATGFNATAPTDSSTIELPVFASDLGITSDSPTFDYSVQSDSLVTSGTDAFNGIATYNAWAPALENGQFETVPVGGTIKVSVGVDASAFTVQKPLGVMTVVLDNASGSSEAILMKAK
jgi:subtilisin family serine protease